MDIKNGEDIRYLVPGSGFSKYGLVVVEAAVTSQLEFDKSPLESFATNVYGLLNVLEACRLSRVPRVAFASSSAVYGPPTMYAASKLMGEALFESYLHKKHFDGVILRYFNTYGEGESAKGDYKSIVSIFLESIGNTGEVVVYGDGEQRRDFIEVRDTARITLELALKASGTFDVGTGRSVSWNEIIRMLKDEGLMFRVRHIPNPLLDYQRFTQADASKLRSLGLEARISIEVGIRELVRLNLITKQSAYGGRT